MTSTVWKVSDELKAYICQGAEIIANSPSFENDELRIKALRVLVGLGAGVGWRPSHITAEALIAIRDNNFKLPKGLERAHIHHRRDTFKLLLGRIRQGEEWWDWYAKRDVTILATRRENRKVENIKSVKKYRIPKDKELFSGKTTGYVYGKKEKEFLKKLAKGL